MSSDPLRFRLGVFVLIFAAVVLGGTTGFSILEQKPWMDALYFVIATIATVGYGDITPVTPEGKIFAILLIVIGAITFLGVFANAAEVMLSRRERLNRMRKLNMVVGVFFSEVGNPLIRFFVQADPRIEQSRKELVVSERWGHEDFARVRQHLKKERFEIDLDLFYRKAVAGSGFSEGSKGDPGPTNKHAPFPLVEAENLSLPGLKSFFLAERDFLIRLLENPVLLEHESFTELLRAVFHLAEEMAYREDFDTLPHTDRAHLAGDMNRAYRLLVGQWLSYMEHLRMHYPYLFSLALRTNPFDVKASPIVA